MRYTPPPPAAAHDERLGSLAAAPAAERERLPAPKGGPARELKGGVFRERVVAEAVETASDEEDEEAHAFYHHRGAKITTNISVPHIYKPLLKALANGLHTHQYAP